MNHLIGASSKKDKDLSEVLDEIVHISNHKLNATDLKLNVCELAIELPMTTTSVAYAVKNLLQEGVDHTIVFDEVRRRFF